MKTVKLEYDKKLEALLEYISITEETNELAKQQRSDELAQKVQALSRNSKKRVYDYDLIIINLYGVLESFVEQIIRAYLLDLEKYIKNYDSLPKAILNNHIPFSADLIKNIDKLDKYKTINKNVVITNLNSCIVDKCNYKINIEAFTHHSSNFRKDAIREIFQNIGFSNITAGIAKSESIEKYFRVVEGLDDVDIKRKSEESTYEILMDLIERRNLIAHGLESDNLLSLEILHSYTQYIQALLQGIFNIVQNKLAIDRIENTKHHVLGRPINTYKKKYVIGLNSQHILIEPGMEIYAKNAKGDRCYIGKIISIMHDGVEQEYIGKDDDWEVGLAVSEEIPLSNNLEYGVFAKDN